MSELNCKACGCVLHGDDAHPTAAGYCYDCRNKNAGKIKAETLGAAPAPEPELPQAVHCSGCGTQLHAEDSLKAGACLRCRLKFALAERDKLQAFKTFVHVRLDEMGVECDPESVHKAAGCRIGGRLDIVAARLEALKEWEQVNEKLKELATVPATGERGTPLYVGRADVLKIVQEAVSAVKGWERDVQYWDGAQKVADYIVDKLSCGTVPEENASGQEAS